MKEGDFRLSCTAAHGVAAEGQEVVESPLVDDPADACVQEIKVLFAMDAERCVWLGQLVRMPDAERQVRRRHLAATKTTKKETKKGKEGEKGKERRGKRKGKEKKEKKEEKKRKKREKKGKIGKNREKKKQEKN